jgi:hypothetical protein
MIIEYITTCGVGDTDEISITTRWRELETSRGEISQTTDPPQKTPLAKYFINRFQNQLLITVFR